MSPQNDRIIAALTCLYKERILHITRGMVRREVEQLEIDLIRFHFARRIHLKTHVSEDIQHPPQLLRGWMQSAQMDSAPWQRHVELFLFKGFRQRRGFDHV